MRRLESLTERKWGAGHFSYLQMAYYHNHNIFYRFEEQKDGEVDSAVFKNVWNWFKCFHEPIFEIARRDHVVHEESCSGSIVGKIFLVFIVVWKDNQRKLFQSILESSTDQDTVPKTTEFTSSVHSSILGSRKGVNGYWWNVFGTKHSGSILMYNARC